MFQDYGYGGIKIFGIKVLYFMMLHELTKNECFFCHLSVEVTNILSMGLSGQYYSFLWTDFLYL